MQLSLTDTETGGKVKLIFQLIAEFIAEFI